MNYIASNIKFLRTVAGYSQSDLAEQLGLNRGNITSYERDVAKPSIDTLPKIADFFNVPLSDFIQRDLSKSMSRFQIEHLYANDATPSEANALAADKLHANLPKADKMEEGDLPDKLQHLLTDLNKINSSVNNGFYKDVNRIANSLESIAKSLNVLTQVQKQQAQKTKGAEHATLHTFM